MATTKIWPIRDNLRRVVDYAANPDKTESGDLMQALHYAVNDSKTERACFVSGINCHAERAFDEMYAVKAHFGKTGGNVAYHCYQSFKPSEVTAKQCHTIGVKLAQQLWGDKYQVLVATHLDREHLHNHLVVNSVSFIDGKKFNDNKRRAEQMLLDARRDYEVPEEQELGIDMLFSDYLLEWLEIVKVRVRPTTYASYSGMTKANIAPYFKRKNLTLRDLEPRHLQTYYIERLRKVKPNSVIREHAVIHQALKYAVKTEILQSNPADKIDRPKKNDFAPGFYDANEMAALFEAVKGHKLELPVLVGAFYGLRRSEVLGLRFSAIDFERNTLTVMHTVTEVTLDGKSVQLAQDSAKTKSSMRTLPLVGQFRDYFLQVKAAQEANKKICGRSYNKKYAGHVFVDELGNLIKPGYLTCEFPKLLERHGLWRIRFHDLRHSCASLLLANGVPMKQIQDWLGHSDFSTTANIYAHLDYSSKISSAEAMVRSIALPANPGFESKWAAGAPGI